MLIVFVTVGSAQFTKNSKSIGGSIIWDQTYYDNQSIGTTFIATPSIGYFVSNDLAVTASFSLTAFGEDGVWIVDDGSFGLGGKYYYEAGSGAVYGGGSFEFHNKIAPRSLVAETGYLLGLNKNVFFDFGLEYLKGLGDNRLSTISLAAGVATFF
ncbi:MAG TPA: hypothetical protein VKS81_10015 [Bacteroidota bacterium]|nr:hypothetical protein [Bacteroidota bacterium]